MKIQVLNWQVSLERVFYKENKLATMYDEVAHRWEKSIDRMGYLDAYNALFKRLSTDGTMSNLKRGSTILDAGIGTGALSTACLNEYPHVELSGIDISEAMLDAAHTTLIRPCDLRQASITDLPYDDNSFDMVMSAHVLEHLHNPEAGIAELMRVLKPNCPFIIVATRMCLATRILSLKWNFKPMSKRDVQQRLHHHGAKDFSVQPLANTHQMTQMSIVYTGMKSS